MEGAKSSVIRKTACARKAWCQRINLGKVFIFILFEETDIF